MSTSPMRMIPSTPSGPSPIMSVLMSVPMSTIVASIIAFLFLAGLVVFVILYLKKPKSSPPSDTCADGCKLEGVCPLGWSKDGNFRTNYDPRFNVDANGSFYCKLDDTYKESPFAQNMCIGSDWALSSNKTKCCLNTDRTDKTCEDD